MFSSRPSNGRPRGAQGEAGPAGATASEVASRPTDHCLPELDRATRSMLDGIQIIQRVAGRRTLVKVLDKPYLDLTSTMGLGHNGVLECARSG